MSLYGARCLPLLFSFFFFNDTATTEIYTLSLHDALPISASQAPPPNPAAPGRRRTPPRSGTGPPAPWPAPSRSEEHTSELQSQSNLVCRLLLEKKKWNAASPGSPGHPRVGSRRTARTHAG